MNSQKCFSLHHTNTKQVKVPQESTKERTEQVTQGRNVPPPVAVWVEPKARNGGDNARNGSGKAEAEVPRRKLRRYDRQTEEISWIQIEAAVAPKTEATELTATTRYGWRTLGRRPRRPRRRQTARSPTAGDGGETLGQRRRRRRRAGTGVAQFVQREGGGVEEEKNGHRRAEVRPPWRSARTATLPVWEERGRGGEESAGHRLGAAAPPRGRAGTARIMVVQSQI